MCRLDRSAGRRRGLQSINTSCMKAVPRLSGPARQSPAASGCRVAVGLFASSVRACRWRVRRWVRLIAAASIGPKGGSPLQQGDLCLQQPPSSIPSRRYLESIALRHLAIHGPSGEACLTCSREGIPPAAERRCRHAWGHEIISRSLSSRSRRSTTDHFAPRFALVCHAFHGKPMRWSLSCGVVPQALGCSTPFIRCLVRPGLGAWGKY